MKHREKFFSNNILSALLWVLLILTPLHAGNTTELGDVKLVQDKGGIYIKLLDVKGKPIAVNDFHQYKSRNMLEIDIPGVSYPKPIKTLTYTLPGIELFKVMKLSEEPPVVRITIFSSLKSKEKYRAFKKSSRLYITGSSKKDSPFSSAIIPVSEAENEIINLDFDNTDLITIMNALARKLGLTLVTDSGVKGIVSIHSNQSSVRDILDALLLSRGYKYSLTENRLTVISPIKSPFETRQARELFFKDLPLKDALQTISRMLNINIIIHESVEDRNINFYVENLPLDELFDLLLKTNSLIKKQYNKNTFIIMSDKEKSTFDTLVYKTYKLVNTTPSIVQNAISSIEALSKKVNTKNWAVSEELNQIIAYETPEAHEIIEKIIRSTNEKPTQVIIEMKLLEISRNGAKDLGFEMINGIQMGPNNTLPKNYNLAAKLSFLESSSKAKVLASPKIRAMNKKSASIHIGETIPVPFSEFAVGTVSNTGTIQGGSISPQNVSQAVSQEIKRFKDVPVGIRLNVTPEIFRDDEVELDVDINVDTVLNISEEGQIHKSTKTTATRVRVKDGETIVFGGLIQQRDSASSQAPPFINRLPLISSLFRKRRDVQDSELVLLLTPHIVNKNEKFSDARK